MIRPETRLIQVTQADIDASRLARETPRTPARYYDASRDCPVARAVKRALDCQHPIVCTHVISPENGTPEWWTPSEPLVRAINDWDHFQVFQPGRYRITRKSGTNA